MKLLSPAKYLKISRALLANRFRGEAVYPFYASFKITTHCHLQCKFCNIHQQQKPNLPLDQVKKVLANLSDSSIVVTTIEGGEPFLHPKIGEILDYAGQMQFYVLLVTCITNLETHPMKEYCRNIDFLHLSLDEGHNNLALFDRLEEFKAYGSQVSVQSVVDAATLPALEEKVRRCHRAGVNIVILPMVEMNRAAGKLPDLREFKKVFMDAYRKYPATMYTPPGYFDNVLAGRCTTDSVVIDADGRLYYPCHILEEKGEDLTVVRLDEYVRTGAGREQREKMRQCQRHCGWYQFFATSEYVKLGTALKSLGPLISKTFRKPPLYPG
jgi:MoaA/NifB/PqqE/SkfB family radical SAM enzyme